ncbi:MAG: 2-succinyl-5-enolpyruvyl-6-hydroxy-3-cyclohexene-1-carboxylic-acid synthase [Acidimicrobiales bacterium]
MQQSVPSPNDVQATFAATLFDQWIANGLRDVVLCPGSRSTPLTLACAERGELTLHVRIDERSAGFFALGRALVTQRPVAVVVTSGTAAAELHAVVAEADAARVPLIVITADRPEELHGVGAPQTIEQAHLYGAMVRRFEDPGVPRAEAMATWRSLAESLWRRALGGPDGAGPVHLNAPFREPLVGRALALPPAFEGVASDTPVRVTDLAVDGRRVLCVVGPGIDLTTIEQCVDLDWVVLGDATARSTLAYFDALLRDERFVALAKPDLIVRLGGMPASKVLQAQLKEWNVDTVALGSVEVADPDRMVRRRLDGVPSREQPRQRGDAAYVQLWSEASRRAGEFLEARERADDRLDEPGVARELVRASSQFRVPLVIGSSMPVRDVEWFAPSRTSPTYSNRGVNGIDGVVSTVLGVAAGSRALGLVGDLTMLHDVSALVEGLGESGGSCVLVVANNRGGGIFSFLPQATSLEPTRFERLFGTPRPHNLAAIAEAFGHASVSVTSRTELNAVVSTGLDREGLTVVIAQVPSREQNVRRHEELNRALRECFVMDAS